MHTFSRRALLAGFAPLIALCSLDAQGRVIPAIAAPGAYIIDDWRWHPAGMTSAVGHSRRSCEVRAKQMNEGVNKNGGVP